MNFEDRYSTAVRTNNLKSEEKTTFSSSDVLGAAGLAAKLNPLAIALLRLFTGDNRAADTIVELMSAKMVGKAFRLRDEIDMVAASLIARMVLDWYRDSVCKQCGGHGFKRMTGAPTLSDQACGNCSGSGKRDFDSMFPASRLELAKWVSVELEREMGIAGPASMAMLRPRLDL